MGFNLGFKGLISLVIDYAVQSITVCTNFEDSFCFVHLTGGPGV